MEPSVPGRVLEPEEQPHLQGPEYRNAEETIDLPSFANPTFRRDVDGKYFFDMFRPGAPGFGEQCPSHIQR